MSDLGAETLQKGRFCSASFSLIAMHEHTHPLQMVLPQQLWYLFPDVIHGKGSMQMGQSFSRRGVLNSCSSCNSKARFLHVFFMLGRVLLDNVDCSTLHQSHHMPRKILNHLYHNWHKWIYFYYCLSRSLLL